MFRFVRNFTSFVRIMLILTFSGVILSKKKRAKRLVQTLVRLGPSFIKLGQTLSVRSDLVGEEIAFELTRLQDRLPPFSYSKVVSIIKKELGANIDELFSSFERVPVAAASIAEVHKAVTFNGDVVAVKILRPNIDRLFKRDIEFFYFAASILNLFSGFRRLKLKEVIATLEKSAAKELDLRLEAASASKLKQNSINDKGVYIPKIFWELTSRAVLTIEWVDGIAVNDKAALKKDGHNMKELAQNLAVTFFNQVYRDGFFHADIHPGNLFVNAKGEIVPIDFGIMGQLSNKDRFSVALILKGFIEGDYDYVAKVHLDAGYIPKDTDLGDFSLASRAIGEPIMGLPVEQVSVARLLALLFKVTRDFNMETQPQLLLLQKTMVLIEGVGQELYHKVNMWKLAEPWIEQAGKTYLSKRARIKSELYSLGDVVSNLPQRLRDLDAIIEKKAKGERYVEAAGGSFVSVSGWLLFFTLLLYVVWHGV